MAIVTSVKNFTLFALLLSFLCFPIAGCGPSTEPVGVEDNSFEEAEQDQETEEYVSGEEGI